jgi:hypothetical protein
MQNTIQDSAILLQKNIRRYLQQRKLLIPSAKYQTKKWRQKRCWYSSGKSNECEKYQIEMIIRMIRYPWVKTYDRINSETYNIISNRTPLQYEDGYVWSENFDDRIYYFNLKITFNSGGAQTRTLREVFHFIKTHLHCIFYAKIQQDTYS